MQGQTSSYVVTTLVTAPADVLLTSLANVHTELDIPTADTSKDAFLTRAITQASAAIARHLNRVLGLATWQDEFRPARGVWGEGVRAANNPLLLTRWPLNTTVLEFTGNTYSTTLIDGIASTAGMAQGNLIGGPGITAGDTIATGGVGANSITLNAAATATASAVALNTGISVSETVAGVTTGLTAGTDYEIEGGSLLAGDEGPARLWRLNPITGQPRNWSAGQVLVVYPAGYALPSDASPNMPADIEDACLRLVTQRYQSRGRDPLLMQQTTPQLGDQRWWVGASPGQNGALPPEIEALLAPYRVPVTAAA